MRFLFSSTLLALLVLMLPDIASAGVYMGANLPAPVDYTQQYMSKTDASSGAAGSPSTTAGSGMAAPYRNIAPFIVKVYTGSLKANVQRIVKKAGWGTLLWQLPYDYKWTGTLTLHGTSMESVLVQLLQNYPLQAVFYQGNHVVAIVPRSQTRSIEKRQVTHANS